MEQKLLFKYRGVQNFRFFTDIILRNRLYASQYVELNDPMEGQYYYNRGELDKSIQRKIKDDKGNLRLCSLSRKNDNELMWSHYSEGHRGVAIGLTIDRARYDVRPIQYTGLAYLTNGQIENDTPKEILSHKLNVWAYEEEERVFVSDKFYVDVQIRQVITGRAMSNQDYSFIRDVIDRINPSIEIIKAQSYM
ncbi:DUF2971 domain-containing protein [Desertivirga xinjiangensis]|uniref:DUF2971 domain-containing protein n=1 Tax=Desertivirga xinjiangensis TaxID=539206 RepID=UPI00210EE016|nr:DUF2971 domain-containing protein [Pedobacter xinjiangensis]